MIILASQSPRRAELLKQINIDFVSLSIDLDESALDNETADHYVVRLAQEKSRLGWNRSAKQYPVLGADTIVVLKQHILGKPQDLADATRMLRLLSDSIHEVFTAVAITIEQQQVFKLVKTQVKFCPLTDEQIEQYWQSGEPQDKAGSYAIQGIAAQFVEYINGSYSAVVGLPLFETRQLLNEIGYGQ